MYTKKNIPAYFVSGLCMITCFFIYADDNIPEIDHCVAQNNCNEDYNACLEAMSLYNECLMQGLPKSCNPPGHDIFDCANKIKACYQNCYSKVKEDLEK